MNGIQAWVALPEDQEEREPGFWHQGEGELPVIEEDGLWARLIAGSAFGLSAKVKTHSPMFYLHCEMAPGARHGLVDNSPARAAYVAARALEAEGQRSSDGPMQGFAPGQPADSRADGPATIKSGRAPWKGRG